MILFFASPMPVPALASRCLLRSFHLAATRHSLDLSGHLGKVSLIFPCYAGKLTLQSVFSAFRQNRLRAEKMLEIPARFLRDSCEIPECGASVARKTAQFCARCSRAGCEKMDTGFSRKSHSNSFESITPDAPRSHRPKRIVIERGDPDGAADD